MSKAFKSIDELLKKMESDSNELSGPISTEELFDNGFMEKNTDFSTLNDFLKYHNIIIKRQEDFDKLDNEILDDAISKSSDFSTWNEFKMEASKEITIKKMRDKGYNVK